MIKQETLKKLKDKSARIAVVGLGYVGLPLSIRYANVGFKVVGIDIDQKKIDLLKRGLSYIQHIPDEEIKTILDNEFKPTTDFSQIFDCDAIILCVPTPLNINREPDLRFIMNTMELLVPYLRKGQVLSLESTTYPGTTEEQLLPIIENTSMVVGKDIFLVYSPEREDPGNLKFNTSSIPKVVGGHTKDCLEVGLGLYKPAIDQLVPVSSTKVAEMTKLLENIHRSVNIGLVNEMKIISDKMGVDIFEVVDAAATKPFGFTPYYPGPGIGGHCIPIDPFYLTWKAREYGVHTRFIELAGEVNASMPQYVVTKIMEGLNELGKPLKDAKILMLGIAYKKNVDDMRESPSVFIMEMLEEKGAVVAYSDPHVDVFPTMREHYFDLSSVQLTAESLKQYDAVVVATAHDSFDYDMIRKNAQLIIDTRGVYREQSDNIIKS